jgi:hypothetical protein
MYVMLHFTKMQKSKLNTLYIQGYTKMTKSIILFSAQRKILNLSNLLDFLLLYSMSIRHFELRCYVLVKYNSTICIY